jgi:uncharacterized protein (DUF305 family)
MTTRMIAALAAAIALAAGSALAQSNHGAHGGAPATDKPAGTQQMLDMLGKMADSPSTKAFEEANEKMHHGMAIEFSGDADLDFVRGMIPHHQGAVDMARIILEHGKDPELRQLAENIIASQEEEIAFMKAWLAKNGPAGVQGETMPGMGH